MADRKVIDSPSKGPPAQPTTAAAVIPQSQDANVALQRPRHHAETIVWENRRVLDAILPKEWKTSRLLGMLALELSTNRALARADPLAVAGGLFACAKVQLEPNTPHGLAYLIPYGDRVEFVLGYQGARRLVLRSGKVAKLESFIVHLGEPFEFERTSEGVQFLHQPSLDGWPRDHPQYHMRGGYSIATFVDRSIPDSVDIMTREEILYIKELALASKHGPGHPKHDPDKWGKLPWNAHEREMWRKTITKRHAKMLPKPDEAAFALELDSRGEGGRQDLADLLKSEIQKANAITVHQLRDIASEKQLGRTAGSLIGNHDANPDANPED